MKRSTLVIVAAIALLLFSGVASAQGLSKNIDGSQHPEQISDAAAYSLFFAHFSNMLADPTLDSMVKVNLFQTIDLSPTDEGILVDALNDHKVRRDKAIELQNQANEKAIGRGEAVANFAPIHKAVVAQTRENLKKTLSADGLAKLDVFVQAEKKKMRVSPQY